jgi:putative heme iron utilization protein
MNEYDWVKEFPAAVTVCDPEGIILAMNDKAAKGHEKDGGYNLLGSNMLDCHPEPARVKTERHKENDLSIALVQEWRLCRIRRTLAGNSLRVAAFHQRLKT